MGLRLGMQFAAVWLWLGSVSNVAACGKADFEVVVGAAAASLRELNGTMRPSFEDKLKALKQKRAWTQDQFLVEAIPLVQDEQISTFDDESTDILKRIESLGSEGARASIPDCGQLVAVREHMKALVDVQRAKWAYMFEKLDRELAK